MSVSSILKSRIIIKHDTTANWEDNPLFVPFSGEFIVFSDAFQKKDGTLLPGVKVGDGSTTVLELPFISSDFEEIQDIIDDHINNTVVHITQEERERWNDKVDCRYDEDETLLFFKDNLN